MTSECMSSVSSAEHDDRKMCVFSLKCRTWWPPSTSPSSNRRFPSGRGRCLRLTKSSPSTWRCREPGAIWNPSSSARRTSGVSCRRTRKDSTWLIQSSRYGYISVLIFVRLFCHLKNIEVHNCVTNSSVKYLLKQAVDCKWHIRLIAPFQFLSYPYLNSFYELNRF